MQASFERLVSVSIKVNLVILTVRHLIKISVSHLTHGPCCYLSLWGGLGGFAHGRGLHGFAARSGSRNS